MSDRRLFVALYQLGWDGLITNNYRMLRIPAELAAIIKTKATVVAIEGLGHDPLRAVGALLLELPGLPGRVVPSCANVFRLSYARRRPVDAWRYLARVAESRGQNTEALWQEVQVSDEELAASVF
ncbi:MAG: hypothetical protein GEU93_03040 [Propionibacteriales bacterium]|nr:hypothetical protein [Propionibacteriales bacterium]